MIPRSVEPSLDTEAFAYATRILSIPRVPTKALVVFLGMGEDERLIHACRRWERDEHLEYFLVAGPHSAERTARRCTLEQLKKPPFSLREDMTDNVGVLSEAANTKVQADWTAQMVEEKSISSVTISAPDYHMPRAYGTLLMSLFEHVPWDVALIPDPTPLSPLHISPETGKTLSELTHAEWQRICEYQAKGHVVRREPLERYLDMLYQEYIYKELSQERLAT